MKRMLLSLLILVFSVPVFAQASKQDILNPDVTITWLGVDFSQLKFIGLAAQWKEAGEISDSELKDKYFRS